jgi:hypothetical protein
MENPCQQSASERRGLVESGQKSGPESTVIDRGLRPPTVEGEVIA